MEETYRLVKPTTSRSVLMVSAASLLGLVLGWILTDSGEAAVATVLLSEAVIAGLMTLWSP